MDKLSTNSGDPDQTWHSAASDKGLHSLPVYTIFEVLTKIGYGDIAFSMSIKTMIFKINVKK